MCRWCEGNVVRELSLKGGDEANEGLVWQDGFSESVDSGQWSVVSDQFSVVSFQIGRAHV